MACTVPKDQKKWSGTDVCPGRRPRSALLAHLQLICMWRKRHVIEEGILHRMTKIGWKNKPTGH